jgi:hypothetical protein
MLNEKYIEILSEIKSLYDRDLELSDLLLFENNSKIYQLLDTERRENILRARALLQLNHKHLMTYEKILLLKLAIKLIGKDELYIWLNIPENRYSTTPIFISVGEHSLQYVVLKTVVSNVSADNEDYNNILQCCKILNLKEKHVVGQTIYYIND